MPEYFKTAYIQVFRAGRDHRDYPVQLGYFTNEELKTRKIKSLIGDH